MTVEQVAEHLLCSPSKVSRMETGHRGATLRDVRDLCDLYGVDEPAERERLMTLAREGKQQGWWQSFALPHAPFIGLEQAAASMRIYHCAVVPGILQIGDYTRALHNVGIPEFPDPDVIEQRVAERATRQEVLTRANPPSVEIILDEAVLHRPIGGKSVMGQQLDRIIAVSAYPNVTVKVLPFAVGAHPALESDFIMLDFSGKAPSVVYVEGLVGNIFLERELDIERYEQVFKRLRAMASNPKDSVAMLTKIRATYTSD